MIALGVLLLTLLYVAYSFIEQKYGYWKKKKIPHTPPNFILGNYGPYILQQQAIHENAQLICQQFPDEPMIGAYYGTEPVLMIKDAELVKLITTKDFYYFHGRELSDYTQKETLTKHMFFAHGDKWKVLRQNLSPMFSSGKMKMMFHIIEKNTRVLEQLLDEEAKSSPDMDIRSVMARFTMDSICSTALGLEANVMKCDSLKDNKFRAIADQIFDTSSIRGFKVIARAIWPKIFYGLGLQLFPNSIYTFFEEQLLEVFASRGHQPGSRQDFVDLLLNVRNKNEISGDSMRNVKLQGKEKISLKVDDDFLVAQCFLFFAAGFETSSTTSSFTLYEIAKHPEIQEKVLAEVDNYIENRGEVQYDCVTQLPYLEQCIDETLRLYPVLRPSDTLSHLVLPLLGVLTREVYEDYTFPSGLQVEKGMRVHLPVYHMHRDPKYFKDPEVFRPERFSPEEKNNIVPYSYFPFGEGPRICIGMRFAKMQMLAGLTTLLKKYSVELAPGMPREVRFESRAMVTQCKTAVRLRLRPRPGWEERVFK